MAALSRHGPSRVRLARHSSRLSSPDLHKPGPVSKLESAVTPSPRRRPSRSAQLSRNARSGGTHLDQRLVDTFVALARHGENEIEAAYPAHARPLVANT
jgi:hypothetical protein